MRVRLKADGRLVEILPDGRERPLPPAEPEHLRYMTSPSISPDRPAERRAPTRTDGSYAREVRASTHLTQTQFAERIGVPVETVRNWEQGKRSPRGPARALLRLIHHAPGIAFDALGPHA
jgi:putative transcriptional regulator